MKSDIEQLINTIIEIDNPLIIANKLTYFITDSLRENKINLYEAYLLNLEVIKFRRLGYTNHGYGSKVNISICISIINQILLAYALKDNRVISTLKEWGREALELNVETRTHYILDRYDLFLNIHNSSDLLEELVEVRKKYEYLSDNKGPYHIEVFPYQFYSPEEILLQDNFDYNKLSINAQVEDLIVELNLK